MYTHDYDMPTPEDQAAKLDEARTAVCDRLNRTLLVYSIPQSPSARLCGRGFECHAYNTADMSFSKYQQENPGGWWGVAFAAQSACYPCSCAANVLYEMLAGNIPGDVDRIAVLPACNTQGPLAEMANMLGEKMIARIYDGEGITARVTEQPGLESIGRPYLPGVLGSGSVRPEVFPDYSVRFTQDDVAKIWLRAMVSISVDPAPDPKYIDELSAPDFKVLLSDVLSEMERRTFGAFKPPDIPSRMLEPPPPELFVLLPRLAYDESYKDLYYKSTDILDAWNRFMESCGLSLYNKEKAPGKAKRLSDDLLELGRLTQSFSSSLIELASDEKGRRYRPVHDSVEVRAREDDFPATSISSASKEIPALSELEALPKTSYPMVVDVRHGYDAYAVRRGHLPTASLDSLAAKDGVYAVLIEDFSSAPERTMAAILCGMFPGDAKTIVSIPARVRAMRSHEKNQLLSCLDELGCELAYDESGLLAAPLDVARYCIASHRQRAYFSDDLPILPEYAAALADSWQEELHCRGEKVLFGFGFSRRTTSSQLAPVLSEGRISLDGPDVCKEPLRCVKEISAPLSFMPACHPAMEMPGFTDTLAELAVLTGIWRAALVANNLPPAKSFPGSADLDLLEHIGHQQGIYHMISAYYAGVPLEDIIGDEAAAKMRADLIETLGYILTNKATRKS